MTIIAKGIIWIIIDTILLLRQGTLRIFIDTLLRAQESATTRSVFDMHRLMIAIDLHLRVIAIDLHIRVIAIAIAHLMIVIDIDMEMNQGEKRTVIAVHPLAHRRSPPHTAPFRLDQDRHVRRPPMENQANRVRSGTTGVKNRGTTV